MPGDSTYTLSSAVRRSQMVPLQHQSSRTLTCAAVKNQETVNYTDQDRDAHKDARHTRGVSERLRSVSA